MNGDERRKKIINILSSSKSPVAGVALAKELDVSRQVIVQDIALLRANGAAIFSTNRGYLIQADKQYSRVLKVVHEDDEVEEELSTIVDAGGHVKDVFVYHKVYGVIRANMDIKSRRDVRNYLEEIRTGKSSLLKNVTSGYHYHTICAESEEVLDAIQEELKQKGSLQSCRTMSRWISGETTRTRRRFNFIIKLKRNIIIARVKARAVFDFYLISRFSPVSPMYDPSGSPPSGCPISHLFLAARRAASPPVCGCSRASFVPFGSTTATRNPPSDALHGA